MLPFPALYSGSCTFTWRHPVDGDRSTSRAMARIDKPAAGPRGISCRSSRERRSSERFRGVGLLPPWEPEDPVLFPGAAHRALLSNSSETDRVRGVRGAPGAPEQVEQVELLRSPAHGG